MTGSALFHELREDTCMIGLFPFLRHMVEDAFTLGLSLPVGNDLALVGVDILLTDGIALQFTLVQRVQVFHRVAGQLWESRHGFRQRTALTYNQFLVTDIDSLLLTYLVEIPGPEDGNRHGAVVLLIESSLYQGTFDAQCGGRVEILLAQMTYALIHATQVLRVFYCIVHISCFFALYTSSIVIGFLMVPNRRAPFSVMA